MPRSYPLFLLSLFIGILVLPFDVTASGADELKDTYYFLDYNWSTNSVGQPPTVALSSGLSGRIGQEYAHNSFIFDTAFSNVDISNEGWYLYIVYFDETSPGGDTVGGSVQKTNGNSSYGFSQGDSIASKEKSNLWISMWEGEYFDGFGSSTDPSTYISQQIYSIGCATYCRQPIGIAFSKQNLSSEIAAVSTDADIYDLFKSIIQENISDIDDDITSTTTLMKGIYVVSGDIEIPSGVTVNIEPGAVLKFDTSTSSSLLVNGTLNANGTPEGGQIVFTSIEDDYFEDTNENGTSTVPVAGDWGGIVVGSSGVVNLTDSIVRYGGSTNSYSSQIYNDGGTLNLIDSRIVYGTTNGVKNNSGTATIEGTELAYNTNGLYVNGGAVTATADNVIHDNSSYGIFNNTMTVIDAQNNYWELESGPYHPSTNPLGVGDTVSDYVDFDPWTINKHFTTGFYSVSGGQIVWAGTTTPYTTEWGVAVSRWNDLASINISQGVNEDVSVDVVDRSDVAWSGKWDPLFGADEIKLNHHFLQYATTNQIINTILHELGHSLGLGHSFTGNIMYYSQTSQFILGDQDIDDYYYLWP